MDREPLSLEHQGLLTSLFSSLNSPISEYSFSNLYLFRKLHSFELLKGKKVYLMGKTREGLRYLMPTSPIDQLDAGELHEAMTLVDFLFPISEKDLSFFDNRFFAYCLDSDSDYLFKLSKMEIYPGRHLDGKRNLARHFFDQYESSWYPLTLDRIEDAKQILEQWKESFGKKEDDYEACLEGLILWEKLGLEGIILYANRLPVGFLAGHYLNSEVFVVHFAKADKSFKGVYEALYQTLAHFLLETRTKDGFLNLEQDLGHPQLAKAKLAYVPDQRIRKWRLRYGDPKEGNQAVPAWLPSFGFAFHQSS